MTGDEHRAHSESAAPAHRNDESQQGAGMPTASELSRKSSLSRYTTKRRNRGRGIVIRSIIIAVVALVVVGVGVAMAYINNINAKLSAGVTEELLATLSEREQPDDPFYMLLLGVDKSQERADADGAEYWNFRADTIILARIDPKDVKVTLISIPRDTYVDMHENGQDKINAAYSIGGPSYMVEVVQEFAGVPISHYAEFDFEGFVAIVDQIGGIDVTLPVPVSDPEYTELELSAGDHHLNGWDALMLCRSRHAYDDYGGGDFYRAANQRMVISAVARKVLASDLLTMSNTIATLAQYTTTDMSVEDIIALGMQMKDLDIDNNFYSGQEPTISTYYNDLWYEICDTEAWQTMMRRVDSGLPPYSDESEDFTSGIAGTISSKAGSGDGEENHDSSSESNSAPDGKTFDGSVLVLNATPIEGLAGDYAATLGEAGFTTQADTAYETREEDLILYNGEGNRGRAEGVREKLGNDAELLLNDGTWPENYDVVLILGTSHHV